MLKLKFQYFGHLMWRADSFERPWTWEKLKSGGEGDDRGWDGWMASLTHWTWVWASSGSWWWTGKPGMLQSMGSQKVRHDGVTELNWTWYLRQKISFSLLCQILFNIAHLPLLDSCDRPTFITLQREIKVVFFVVVCNRLMIWAMYHLKSLYRNLGIAEL